MSLSFMMIVSLMYIALLFGATLYNRLKSQNDLFISSAFVLFVYAATHLGNTLWLSSLPAKELLETHYLYFAAVQTLLALGLFLINRKKLRAIMSITIVLLVVEVLLGYAVHIDRNVIALNGALVPNGSLSASWLLWGLRDGLSQFTTLTVLLALTLPRVYQVATKDNTEAFEVLKKVDAYLATFAQGSRMKGRAQAFLDYSAEGLCVLTGDETEEYHYEVGTLLLNQSIKMCCYEPGRTKPVGMFGRVVYWLRS